MNDAPDSAIKDVIRTRPGFAPTTATLEEEGFVVLPRVMTSRRRRAMALSTVAIAVVALGGCGVLSSTVRIESSLLSAPEPAESGPRSPHSDLSVSVPAEPVEVSGEPAAADSVAGEGGDGTVVTLAQAPTAPEDKEPAGLPSDEEDYDPWERFNEKVFEFNRQADRLVLKPVAKVYSVVVPEPFELMIANGFDNISFVPRLINSLLQAKFVGASRELSRFLINSTLGIGGLFDAAKYWGIEKSREDFGQTLGVWGVSPGPYLIVPFMEPMTVRDGIGRGVDSLMNPLSYVIPFIWTGISLKLGEIVNDRALNLELFQGFEESVVDLYSAVRHGYLRRREQLIKE
jgi:phospholipid-binding lipoprotein MlaA